MLPLFILFVVLPITEIMVLINVSGTIGGVNTFIVVLITAFFGAYFVRQQGFALLGQIQSKVGQGNALSTQMAEGLLLLIAGVLLITPGFITDIFGFLFTLPFSRAPIASFLVKKLVVHLSGNQAGFSAFHQQGSFNHHNDFNNANEYDNTQHAKEHHCGSDTGDIIDGEYTDKTENDRKNRLN